MATVDNGVDYVSAPKDYHDLFTTYWTYVVYLVRKHGIEDSRAEDVASEILTRFFERDFLNEFDPSMVFEYQGELRPARFKSFLSKFVITYVRGYKDKQHREKDRERLLCDMPVSTGSQPSGATWLDVFGPGCDGGLEDAIADDAQAQELIDALRDFLADVPPRSKFDTCDLVALFDAVVEQIREDGEWHIGALRRQFQISSTAMHSWMWWLRANLAQALNRPVPPRRQHTARSAR